MTHLTLVTSSLRRRALRTIAAMLAFTAAVGPCLVGVCATSRVREIQEAFDRPFVGVRAFIALRLPLAYLAKLAAVPGVGAVDWYTYVRGDDGSGRSSYGIWGTSANYLDAVPNRMLHPVDSQAVERWRSTRNGALVTKDLADRMRWRVDQSVELKTAAGRLSVAIVGLLDGLTPERVVVHYEMLNLAAKLDNEVSAFAVRSTNRGADELGVAIDAAFKDSVPRTLSFSSRRVAATLFAGSARIDFLIQQTLLLLAIGVAVSTGAMAASIRERKAELAALRAIGYSRMRIALLIVAEAELIALTGTLLAVLPLLALFHDHGFSLGHDALNNITVSPEYALVAIVCAAVLGLVSGAVPVLALGWRVSSLDLADG